MGDGAVQEDRPDDRACGQGGQRRDAQPGRLVIRNFAQNLC
jgi:hypothetical protein